MPRLGFVNLPGTVDTGDDLSAALRDFAIIEDKYGAPSGGGSMADLVNRLAPQFNPPTAAHTTKTQTYILVGLAAFCGLLILGRPRR